jgi:hypothetical protein
MPQSVLNPGDEATGAAVRARADAMKELNPSGPTTPAAVPAPAASAQPATPKAKARSIPAPGPYGSQGKEKRYDVSDMVKPLGSMPVYDRGGKVNVRDGKHQVAILKQGERVLTEKQNEKYEKSNPAENATEMKIYDNGGKVAATPFDMITGGKGKAPKTIHHHEYSKTHNGKHVVTHKHHLSEHKDETHMFDKFSDAAAHMDQNPPQPEQSEQPEAPAAGAAPAAAGAGAPPAAAPAM